MTTRSFLSIVLAAGLGTRMRSDLPKVMHPIGNLPMISHVLNALRTAETDRIAVVIGPGMESLQAQIQATVSTVSTHLQTDRLGTAHAALAASSQMADQPDDVLVLFGDTPLVTVEAIGIVRDALAQGADVAVLGFETSNPFGYGRLLTEGDQLVAIREEKEASPDERFVTFCNSGIMGFRGSEVLGLLQEIGNNNIKGEYYLTDAVEIANARGLKVVAVTGREEDVQGINTRAQLAACEAVFQRRMRDAALDRGVALQAPETVYFSHDTMLEPDVTVEPNVVFGLGVSVATGARIRAFSHLEGAQVGKGSTVGPYARLRPGAILSERARIGNFVEIKNASIGVCAKVNHLTYIGDANIGANSNIGAGTITCNYDGFGKHQTKIGAGTFVGSNSTLIAPVSLGEGVYVAAGSVVTDDVERDSLVIGRSRQSEKPGRAADLRTRFKAAKDAKS